MQTQHDTLTSKRARIEEVLRAERKLRQQAPEAAASAPERDPERERMQARVREIERRKGPMSLKEAAAVSAKSSRSNTGLPIQTDKSGGGSRQ
jgi:hypothetical protein